MDDKRLLYLILPKLHISVAVIPRQASMLDSDWEIQQHNDHQQLLGCYAAAMDIEFYIRFVISCSLCAVIKISD